MARRRHEDDSSMRAILRPEEHPVSEREIKEMNKQHGGRRNYSHGSPSSSPSFLSVNASSERAGCREEGEEEQDMEIERNMSSVFYEKSPGFSPPSSMSTMTISQVENRMQVMTTRTGSKSGFSQASSSADHPLVPQDITHAKEKWEAQGPVNQMGMTHPGSGGGFNQTSSSSCLHPPIGFQSTTSARQGWEGCGPVNQMGMTHPGSGGGFNQTSSSSCLHPPIGFQSTSSARQGWDGSGPVNHKGMTHPGSGGGFNRPLGPQNTSNAGERGASSFVNQTMNQSSSGSGFSQTIGFDQVSSSDTPSFPSSQRQQYRHDRPGETVPDSQEMKTQPGGGHVFGQGSASDFNRSPPSPKNTSNGSEGQRENVPDQVKTKTWHNSKDAFDYGKSSVPPSAQSTWHDGDEGGRKKGPERKNMKPSERDYSGHTQCTQPSSPPSQWRGGGAWEDENKKDSDNWQKGASSCCTNNDLKRIQHCQDDLGPLKPTKKHTVLVDSHTFNNDRRILPFEGRHVWQPHFVKLPCVQNTSQGGFSQDTRWKQIKKKLNTLASRQTATVRDVAETILSFNPKYQGQWSFDSLSNFIKCLPREDNYVLKLFPRIAALAVRLPEEVKKAIPLLRAGHIAAITMSQMQIACLLANAFFCTFPHRNTSAPGAEYHNYPTINFSSLFGGRLERKNEKLRAIMHYFNVVTEKKADLGGLVTFERRLLRGTDQPQWKSCTEKINKLHISSDGYIEKEGSGLLQVDFANSWIGGGVLGSGLVQEEILFLINPELIVSRLFTERLQDDECLIITGSQQFSCYSGYSDSFEWLGPHDEKLQRDSWSRLHRQIVALDALHYRSWKEQFRMDKINRELNKAYCGFKGRANHNNPDIATGKWGCGAFNGDPELKAIIQLMAAAVAGRALAFFTFKNRQLEQELNRMHHLLVTQNITVGKLYGLLKEYCDKLQRDHIGLFNFLRKAITRSPPAGWSEVPASGFVALCVLLVAVCVAPLVYSLSRR